MGFFSQLGFPICFVVHGVNDLLLAVFVIIFPLPAFASHFAVPKLRFSVQRGQPTVWFVFPWFLIIYRLLPAWGLVQDGDGIGLGF
jgi:hypothetical protein